MNRQSTTSEFKINKNPDPGLMGMGFNHIAHIKGEKITEDVVQPATPPENFGNYSCFFKSSQMRVRVRCDAQVRCVYIKKILSYSYSTHREIPFSAIFKNIVWGPGVGVDKLQSYLY